MIERVIEILEASVEKHGDQNIKMCHLINILKKAIRDAEWEARGVREPDIDF